MHGRSLRSEGDGRIDTRGARGREPTGRNANSSEKHRDGAQRNRIVRSHAEQQATEQAGSA
jgi:hypothetical protein